MTEPVGKSFGIAKKISTTTDFSTYLKEVSNEGELPFVKLDKFNVIYFTYTKEISELDHNIKKDTEQYILTHTLASEIILKPRNKWVMFSSINWSLINRCVQKWKIHYASAATTTPEVKKIWERLSLETLQYYLYLSELEANLHQAIHPNYKVNHQKKKTLNVSQKLLNANLRLKISNTSKQMAYSDILNTLFEKSLDNNYKISKYSRKQLTSKSKVETKNEIENYVVNQKNKYEALKALKYCAKIKFDKQCTISKNSIKKVKKNQNSSTKKQKKANSKTSDLISLESFLL